MERSLLNAPDWLLALLLVVLLGWAAVGLFRDANRWIRFFFPKYHRRTRSDDAVDEAFQTEAEWNAPPPEGLPPRNIAICGSGEIPRLARLVPDSWRWFLPGSAKAGHPLCEADGQCRLVIGILFESLSREELCPESLCRAVARLDGAEYEAKLVRVEKGEEEEWPAAVMVDAVTMAAQTPGEPAPLPPKGDACLCAVFTLPRGPKPRLPVALYLGETKFFFKVPRWLAGPKYSDFFPNHPWYWPL